MGSHSAPHPVTPPPPQPQPRRFSFSTVPGLLSSRVHLAGLVVLGLYMLFGPVLGVITARDEDIARSYVGLITAFAAVLSGTIAARNATTTRLNRSAIADIRDLVADIHDAVTGPRRPPGPGAPPP